MQGTEGTMTCEGEAESSWKSVRNGKGKGEHCASLSLSLCGCVKKESKCKQWYEKDGTVRAGRMGTEMRFRWYGRKKRVGNKGK